jgi:hypothetical protein
MERASYELKVPHLKHNVLLKENVPFEAMSGKNGQYANKKITLRPRDGFPLCHVLISPGLNANSTRNLSKR